MRTSSGFTLIELMVTIAVAAILMALAAPGFSSLIASNRLSAQASDLISSLSVARSEAIRRGRRITMCKSTDSKSCATTGDWSKGWIVFEDRNSNAAVDTGETVLSVHQSGENPTQVTGSGSVAAYVSFTPDGRAKQTDGSSQSGKLRACSTSPSLADAKRARDIEVNPVGRIASSVETADSDCPEAS